MHCKNNKNTKNASTVINTSTIAVHFYKSGRIAFIPIAKYQPFLVRGAVPCCAFKFWKSSNGLWGDIMQCQQWHFLSPLNLIHKLAQHTRTRLRYRARQSESQWPHSRWGEVHLQHVFHSSWFLPTVTHITPCRRGNAILYAEVGGKDPQKQELKPSTCSSPSKNQGIWKLHRRCQARYSQRCISCRRCRQVWVYEGAIIHSLPFFRHLILTFHWTPTQSFWAEEQRKGKNERGRDYAFKHCCTTKNSHQWPTMRSLSENIIANILLQSH